MQNLQFQLRDEFIELHKLLKITGVCASGGEAKTLVAAGAVRVDGRPVHTKQTLHARTGKSVRHIERHVRLCALAKDDGLREFRKAFEEGTVFMQQCW